jgi:hypothetical protein
MPQPTPTPKEANMHPAVERIAAFAASSRSGHLKSDASS